MLRIDFAKDSILGRMTQKDASQFIAMLVDAKLEETGVGLPIQQ